MAGMIEVRGDIASSFPERTIAGFLAIEDVVVRQAGGRSIGRFERDGRGYYIKKHRPCGWGAICDDLVHGRLPHIGSRPEYAAIRQCEKAAIATMSIAAFGTQGRGPKQQSFIITDEITPAVSLEDFCADWPNNPPAHDLKCKLIDAVADIARKLHTSGMNHRDFYICHFLLTPQTLTNPALQLIDLHRTQLRKRTPRRWIIKDLGGLYFSAMDIGLTQRDVLRFIVRYGRCDAALWRAVDRRARRMYRAEAGR